MLYLTTRDKADAFTAVHALREDRGKCGGLYVPYRLPRFSAAEIIDLQQASFGERIAKVLNIFFNTQLKGTDIEFAVGRRPVRIAAMSHKIAVIETWHNHGGNFESLTAALYKAITGEDAATSLCATWFRIAVRISVLFAVFGDLMKANIAELNKTVDVSVAVGDFTGPMAIWYAMKMGLPIGNIICCCEDDSGLWDFFHHGTLTTTGKTSILPEESATVVPPALESLIFETFGFDQTQIYVQNVLSGKPFRLNDDKLSLMSKGVFCSVVRRQRVESIILNQHNTNLYWMDFNTALGFGGLQDYRSAQAETGTALILSDTKPQQ